MSDCVGVGWGRVLSMRVVTSWYCQLHESTKAKYISSLIESVSTFAYSWTTATGTRWQTAWVLISLVTS